MGDRNKNEPQSSLPIPTYEEAISSRPSSSNSFLGASEVSHDAERQGLLSPAPSQDSNYHPPTVESARSSLDFLTSSNGGSRRNSEEGLRREMSEMDMLDPEYGGHSQMGAILSKRISSLRSGLSSLQLPLKNYFSSFRRSGFRWPALPETFKPSWIIVVRFFAFLLVMSLAYLIFFSDALRLRGQQGGMSAPLDRLRHHLLSHVNSTNIRQNLKYATSYDHVAGTEGGYFIAKWIEETMTEAGLEDVRMEQFDVYLNYPKRDGRKLEIRSPQDKVFKAVLEEESAYKAPPRVQPYVWHGHSKSGEATGPLIYANYGSREDFKRLEDLGITVKGSIVLVRYYGTQGDRALKIKAAELAGAVGCVIYSDPQQDGFKKGKVWPDGPWRPDDSVQRGGVSLMSWVVGDPLSPGFASLPDEKKRLPLEDNPGLNKIPSLPIAWRDVQPLLKALEGHGKKLDGDWVGGVPDVEWWTGDQKGPTVYLENMLDENERQPIRNVLGRIVGLEQPENSIIIGNHYDAWCFGAADPGSGTAIFLEMVRLFGDLRKLGWRPRRTIEFASWDAEEYNMVGSTEHVENRIEELRKNAFAYINVDVGVAGDDFNAAASPILQQALFNVLNHVHDPKSKKSMRKVWNEGNKKVSGLGAGSDYVAFQDLAGTSSIDMGFSGAEGGFPYHSCYDNFEWMEKYGDREFHYHKAMGQIWALLTLDLADEPLLPFQLTTYADAIDAYINDLESYSKAASKDKKNQTDLKALRDANAILKTKARKFHDYDQQWHQTIEQTGGFESTVMTIDRLKYNSKMAEFETNLLDIDGGLPGREQFKHVIFAPQAWSGYDEAFFPGPRDAIDAQDWKGAQNQVDKVAKILKHASEELLK
ncbi:MAG: hypothetical protein MMC23_001896 [Stictis urceolatum]|nr:hypothetical protein [Stictis urceolata]